ncbi:hypothetical protein D3C72_1548330 [compost metagenome]
MPTPIKIFQEKLGITKIGSAKVKPTASKCSFPPKPAINVPINKTKITAYRGIILFAIKYVINIAITMRGSAFIEVKTSIPNFNRTPASIAEANGTGIFLTAFSNHPVNPEMIINKPQNINAPIVSLIGTFKRLTLNNAAPGVDQAAKTGIL